MGHLDRAYTTIDKAGWGSGDWQHEPDKIQWVDEATNLDCLIVRGPSGALCGYVGVPPEHACHGADYNSVRVTNDEGELDYPDVHGGLTYADKCNEGEDESVGICHVPLPGRTDKVWWLGFDCAHSGDITTPKYDRGIHAPYESYKTVSYVRRQVQGLARQLAGVCVVERPSWATDEDDDA